jgi:hypothetical protein
LILFDFDAKKMKLPDLRRIYNFGAMLIMFHPKYWICADALSLPHNQPELGPRFDKKQAIPYYNSALSLPVLSGNCID